jgi:hypothetical protein
MLGFYSVDITIDNNGKPSLIEINGSNSGFDGFLIAYEDRSVQDAISAAFHEFIGNRAIYVVTQLVNNGELPMGYLDKLVQDTHYFRSVENVHATLRKGTVGATWARMRSDRPPSTLGAGTSLDALMERDPRFQRVMLNVADPTYVIPSTVFKDEIDKGILSFKNEVKGRVAAHRLAADDVVWFRSPTLAFAEPMTSGVLVNPEFPYDAVADNKLFTYDVMRERMSDYLPLSVPMGNRCSSSAAVETILAGSTSEHFIRKPLLGSQARGIEIFRRQDVVEYVDRLRRLEQADQQHPATLPLELQGVPDLLASWVLRYDISLLSELTLSKPVHCRQTGREHYGCMRTLALLHSDDAGHVDLRFMGGYWRLAAVPIDGDGLLWERFVGSQSQGAFCEPVSTDDMRIAEQFSRDVLVEYYRQLAHWPQTMQGFKDREMAYWLERYRKQTPALRDDRLWQTFLAGVSAATDEAEVIKQRAEAAGFRKTPAAYMGIDQVARVRLPYLLKEPQRIVIS